MQGKEINDAKEIERVRALYTRIIGTGSYGTIYAPAVGSGIQNVIKATKQERLCSNYREEFHTHQMVYNLVQQLGLSAVAVPRPGNLYVKKDKKGRVLECFYQMERIHPALADDEPRTLLTHIYAGREEYDQTLDSSTLVRKKIRKAYGSTSTEEVPGPHVGHFIGWQNFVRLLEKEQSQLQEKERKKVVQKHMEGMYFQLGCAIAAIQWRGGFDGHDLEIVYGASTPEKNAVKKLFIFDFDKVSDLDLNNAISTVPSLQHASDRHTGGEEHIKIQFANVLAEDYYYPVPTTSSFTSFRSGYLCDVVDDGTSGGGSSDEKKKEHAESKKRVIDLYVEIWLRGNFVETAAKILSSRQSQDPSKQERLVKLWKSELSIKIPFLLEFITKERQYVVTQSELLAQIEKMMREEKIKIAAELGDTEENTKNGVFLCSTCSRQASLETVDAGMLGKKLFFCDNTKCPEQFFSQQK
jgi:hypothetical protein